MSWEPYTNDIIVGGPRIEDGPGCFVDSKIGYRLFVDESINVTNPNIRLDVTYMKIIVQTNKLENTGKGYWNTSWISWFFGNQKLLFNQKQYDSNNERDVDGSRLNEFKYPYDSMRIGQTYDALPASYDTAIQDSQYISWDNHPIFGIGYINTVPFFHRDHLQFGRSYEDMQSIPYGDISCVLFGEVFNDRSKFIGKNELDQEKIMVDGQKLIISSSAIVDRSTGKVVGYDQDDVLAYQDQEPSSPYYGTNALASTMFNLSDARSWGILREEEDGFPSDEDVVDPYVFHGYTVPFSAWLRTYPASSRPFSTLTRSNESFREITLYHEDVINPDHYQPVEPVYPVNDNRVYRLQHKYDKYGNMITDILGEPILRWEKCLRIGENSREP